MESITRRVFLRRTINGIGGVILASSLGNVSLAQLPDNMSRIILVKHHQATDGVRIINPDSVQNMMDESVKQLTGQPSVADSWASLLPGFKEDHLIAIKVNTSFSLNTHPEVVNAIVNGLTAAGVPENNIIIYDIGTDFLLGARYKLNTGDVGVRCFGTYKQAILNGGFVDEKASVPEEGWGTDQGNPIDILGKKIALSTILTRCHHLINVPVLKAHIWDNTGVTLSLKNHFGSVNAPPLLHDNFTTSCAILNSQKIIKDKTRLVVIDGLFGAWNSNLDPPQFAPNSLIVTKDPVAADYIGAEMINKVRVGFKLPPRDIHLLLEKAAELGVGTNDPGKMELIEMELGDPGKAVDPTGSYKTRWGGIKKR